MTLRAAAYTYWTLLAVALVLFAANIAVAAHNANCWQSVPTDPTISTVGYQTVNVCK